MIIISSIIRMDKKKKKERRFGVDCCQFWVFSEEFPKRDRKKNGKTRGAQS